MANATPAEIKPRLMGIGEAADYLGISRQAMGSVIIQNQIGWVWIGKRKMIPTAILDRLLLDGVQKISQGKD